MISTSQLSLFSQTNLLNAPTGTHSSSSATLATPPRSQPADEPSQDLWAVSPNRHEPLDEQFQRFLDQFKSLTHSIFNHLSANAPQPQHQQDLLISRAEKTRNYLILLLNLHREHDQNVAKIEHLLLKIDDVRRRLVKERIQNMNSISSKLSQIVRDGEEDSQRFQKINSLALTPTQILCYARLIAPYTSAPPAPTRNPKDSLPAPGLDLHDPTLRFLMPFPTEDIIRRGRMGLGMAMTSNDLDQIGQALGETRQADGARPGQALPNNQSYPTAPSRRPPMPPQHDPDDDVFDLDLNPDL